ncbi:MAG: tryptophan 2,3-dioxygenase [Lewinellaceae bacterium]|nr:tryptophan 2,3-dioxygenase [Lewinellaceae bacterium]
MTDEILKNIEAKYRQLGENHATYLQGLLHAKPINYWDYVEVETLLTLQRPRTRFKDESIFIMYHQVTELVLKMMLHEVEQLVGEDLPADTWAVKIERLNRYTSMLINSFDVMKYGMDYDDYNTFRSTLTPASGFQSAQFRLLEIYCTRPENLLNTEGKKRLGEATDIETIFENIYWKDAGTDRSTGKKSLTLRLFEEKYLAQFVALAKKVQGNTLQDKALKMPDMPDILREKLRAFDRMFNIEWPIVHLETAQHYLDSKGEGKAATGGSEWKKYLHPMYQQRKFFPHLWSNQEISDWGKQ